MAATTAAGDNAATLRMRSPPVTGLQALCAFKIKGSCNHGNPSSGHGYRSSSVRSPRNGDGSSTHNSNGRDRYSSSCRGTTSHSASHKCCSTIDRDLCSSSTSSTRGGRCSMHKSDTCSEPGAEKSWKVSNYHHSGNANSFSCIGSGTPLRKDGQSCGRRKNHNVEDPSGASRSYRRRSGERRWKIFCRSSNTPTAAGIGVPERSLCSSSKQTALLIGRMSSCLSVGTECFQLNWCPLRAAPHTPCCRTVCDGQEYSTRLLAYLRRFSCLLLSRLPRCCTPHSVCSAVETDLAAVRCCTDFNAVAAVTAVACPVGAAARAAVAAAAAFLVCLTRCLCGSLLRPRLLKHTGAWAKLLFCLISAICRCSLLTLHCHATPDTASSNFVLRTSVPFAASPPSFRASSISLSADASSTLPSRTAFRFFPSASSSTSSSTSSPSSSTAAYSPSIRLAGSSEAATALGSHNQLPLQLRAEHLSLGVGPVPAVVLNPLKGEREVSRVPVEHDYHSVDDNTFPASPPSYPLYTSSGHLRSNSTDSNSSGHGRGHSSKSRNSSSSSNNGGDYSSASGNSNSSNKGSSSNKDSRSGTHGKTVVVRSRGSSDWGIGSSGEGSRERRSNVAPVNNSSVAVGSVGACKKVSSLSRSFPSLSFASSFFSSDFSAADLAFPLPSKVDKESFPGAAAQPMMQQLYVWRHADATAAAAGSISDLPAAASLETLAALAVSAAETSAWGRCSASCGGGWQEFDADAALAAAAAAVKQRVLAGGEDAALADGAVARKEEEIHYEVAKALANLVGDAAAPMRAAGRKLFGRYVERALAETKWKPAGTHESRIHLRSCNEFPCGSSELRKLAANAARTADATSVPKMSFSPTVAAAMVDGNCGLYLQLELLDVCKPQLLLLEVNSEGWKQNRTGLSGNNSDTTVQTTGSAVGAGGENAADVDDAAGENERVARAAGGSADAAKAAAVAGGAAKVSPRFKMSVRKVMRKSYYFAKPPTLRLHKTQKTAETGAAREINVETKPERVPTKEGVLAVGTQTAAARGVSRGAGEEGVAPVTAATFFPDAFASSSEAGRANLLVRLSGDPEAEDQDDDEGVRDEDVVSISAAEKKGQQKRDAAAIAQLQSTMATLSFSSCMKLCEFRKECGAVIYFPGESRSIADEWGPLVRPPTRKAVKQTGSTDLSNAASGSNDYSTGNPETTTAAPVGFDEPDGSLSQLFDTSDHDGSKRERRSSSGDRSGIATRRSGRISNSTQWGENFLEGSSESSSSSRLDPPSSGMSSSSAWSFHSSSSRVDPEPVRSQEDGAVCQLIRATSPVSCFRHYTAWAEVLDTQEGGDEMFVTAARAAAYLRAAVEAATEGRKSFIATKGAWPPLCAPYIDGQLHRQHRKGVALEKVARAARASARLRGVLPTHASLTARRLLQAEADLDAAKKRQESLLAIRELLMPWVALPGADRSRSNQLTTSSEGSGTSDSSSTSSHGDLNDTSSDTNLSVSVDVQEVDEEDARDGVAGETTAGLARQSTRVRAVSPEMSGVAYWRSSVMQALTAACPVYQWTALRAAGCGKPLLLHTELVPKNAVDVAAVAAREQAAVRALAVARERKAARQLEAGRAAAARREGNGEDRELEPSVAPSELLSTPGEKGRREEKELRGTSWVPRRGEQQQLGQTHFTKASVPTKAKDRFHSISVGHLARAGNALQALAPVHIPLPGVTTKGRATFGQAAVDTGATGGDAAAAHPIDSGAAALPGQGTTAPGAEDERAAASAVGARVGGTATAKAELAAPTSGAPPKASKAAAAHPTEKHGRKGQDRLRTEKVSPVTGILEKMHSLSLWNPFVENPGTEREQQWPTNAKDDSSSSQRAGTLFSRVRLQTQPTGSSQGSGHSNSGGGNIGSGSSKGRNKSGGGPSDDGDSAWTVGTTARSSGGGSDAGGRSDRKGDGSSSGGAKTKNNKDVDGSSSQSGTDNNQRNNGSENADSRSDRSDSSNRISGSSSSSTPVGESSSRLSGTSSVGADSSGRSSRSSSRGEHSSNSSSGAKGRSSGSSDNSTDLGAGYNKEGSSSSSASPSFVSSYSSKNKNSADESGRHERAEHEDNDVSRRAGRFALNVSGWRYCYALLMERVVKQLRLAEVRKMREKDSAQQQISQGLLGSQSSSVSNTVANTSSSWLPLSGNGESSRGSGGNSNSDSQSSNSGVADRGRIRGMKSRHNSSDAKLEHEGAGMEKTAAPGGETGIEVEEWMVEDNSIGRSIHAHTPRMKVGENERLKKIEKRYTAGDESLLLFAEYDTVFMECNLYAMDIPHHHFSPTSSPGPPFPPSFPSSSSTSVEAHYLSSSAPSPSHPSFSPSPPLSPPSSIYAVRPSSLPELLPDACVAYSADTLLLLPPALDSAAKEAFLTLVRKRPQTVSPAAAVQEGRKEEEEAIKLLPPHTCPNTCVLSAWSPWSSCGVYSTTTSSSSAESSSIKSSEEAATEPLADWQVRVRGVLHPPYLGDACDIAAEVRACKGSALVASLEGARPDDNAVAAASAQTKAGESRFPAEAAAPARSAPPAGRAEEASNLSAATATGKEGPMQPVIPLSSSSSGSKFPQQFEPLSQLPPDSSRVSIDCTAAPFGAWSPCTCVSPDAAAATSLAQLTSNSGASAPGATSADATVSSHTQASTEGGNGTERQREGGNERRLKTTQQPWSHTRRVAIRPGAGRRHRQAVDSRSNSSRDKITSTDMEAAFQHNRGSPGLRYRTRKVLQNGVPMMGVSCSSLQLYEAERCSTCVFTPTAFLQIAPETAVVAASNDIFAPLRFAAAPGSGEAGRTAARTTIIRTAGARAAAPAGAAGFTAAATGAKAAARVGTPPAFVRAKGHDSADAVAEGTTTEQSLAAEAVCLVPTNAVATRDGNAAHATDVPAYAIGLKMASSGTEKKRGISAQRHKDAALLFAAAASVQGAADSLAAGADGLQARFPATAAGAGITPVERRHLAAAARVSGEAAARVSREAAGETVAGVLLPPLRPADSSSRSSRMSPSTSVGSASAAGHAGMQQQASSLSAAAVILHSRLSGLRLIKPHRTQQPLHEPSAAGAAASAAAAAALLPTSRASAAAFLSEPAVSAGDSEERDEQELLLGPAAALREEEAKGRTVSYGEGGGESKEHTGDDRPEAVQAAGNTGTGGGDGSVPIRGAGTSGSTEGTQQSYDIVHLLTLICGVLAALTVVFLATSSSKRLRKWLGCDDLSPSVEVAALRETADRRRFPRGQAATAEEDAAAAKQGEILRRSVAATPARGVAPAGTGAAPAGTRAAGAAAVAYGPLSNPQMVPVLLANGKPLLVRPVTADVPPASTAARQARKQLATSLGEPIYETQEGKYVGAWGQPLPATVLPEELRNLAQGGTDVRSVGVGRVALRGSGAPVGAAAPAFLGVADAAPVLSAATPALPAAAPSAAASAPAAGSGPYAAARDAAVSAPPVFAAGGIRVSVGGRTPREASVKHQQVQQQQQRPKSPQSAPHQQPPRSTEASSKQL